MVTTLSLAEARRLALAAQGFHLERPRRPTVRHLRDTIRRLGLLQIDCVNGVCTARYMVPFSRLGLYNRSGWPDAPKGVGRFTRTAADAHIRLLILRTAAWAQAHTHLLKESSGPVPENGCRSTTRRAA